jgi:hypothetical protein
VLCISSLPSMRNWCHCNHPQLEQHHFTEHCILHYSWHPNWRLHPEWWSMWPGYAWCKVVPLSITRSCYINADVSFSTIMELFLQVAQVFSVPVSSFDSHFDMSDSQVDHHSTHRGSTKRDWKDPP